MMILMESLNQEERTRKLASIQKILNIEPIVGADRIEQVTVLGWSCVAKKGEFQIGDQCVYFEIDSILPEREWSEFLRDRKFRIRTIKLKGTLSQGLAIPVSVCPEIKNPKEGDDVTILLGVKKYDREEMANAQLGNKTKSMYAANYQWPSHLQKTDESRIQSNPGVLKDIAGKPFYASVKMDGSSMTASREINGKFHVCSRNFGLKEFLSVPKYKLTHFTRTPLNKGIIRFLRTFVLSLWHNIINKIKLWVGGVIETPTESNFWKVAHKYNLKNIPPGVTVQGELCGPGIQKNLLNLKEHEFYVFNVIENGKRLSYKDTVKFCDNLNLKMVPVFMINETGEFEHSQEKWLKMAEGLYEGTKNQREGLVIRTLEPEYSLVLKGPLSFKAISNKYLLKNDD